MQNSADSQYTIHQGQVWRLTWPIQNVEFLLKTAKRSFNIFAPRCLHCSVMSLAWGCWAADWAEKTCPFWIDSVDKHVSEDAVIIQKTKQKKEILLAHGWWCTWSPNTNLAIVFPRAIVESKGDMSRTLISLQAPGSAKWQCHIYRSASQAPSYTIVVLSLLPFLYSPWCSTGHFAQTQCEQSRDPSIPGHPRASCLLHNSLARSRVIGGKYCPSNACSTACHKNVKIFVDELMNATRTSQKLCRASSTDVSDIWKCSSCQRVSQMKNEKNRRENRPIDQQMFHKPNAWKRR